METKQYIQQYVKDVTMKEYILGYDLYLTPTVIGLLNDTHGITVSEKNFLEVVQEEGNPVLTDLKVVKLSKLDYLKLEIDYPKTFKEKVLSVVYRLWNRAVLKFL